MAANLAPNRAIVKQNPGEIIITDVPKPTLRPGHMLVRTHAIALNPADWTDVDYPDYEGCVVGLDYAGVVCEVDQYNTRSFKPGDRVAGICHGCNNSQKADGAFQRYALVKTDLQIRIPDWMSFEEAASLGVGVLTAGMALFHVINLSPPDLLSESSITETTPWILIYGGSSATGSIAIQLAKLAGLRVVTTCSPRNFALAKRSGADVVLDYRLPKITQLIKETTSDNLIYALDCIATDTTAAICVSSFTTTNGSKKAIYACTLDPNLPPGTGTTVEKRFFLGYTCFGESFVFKGDFLPASQADYEFAVKFMGLAEELLQQGKLKSHPISINLDGTGLEGVVRGLKILKEGGFSGTKLVYTVD